MKAIIYTQTGAPDVLHPTERSVPDPAPGEVRVRVKVSGVNPTDWKARRGGPGRPLEYPEIVPNQDGAGIIDAVGEGVSPDRVGERVWVWEASWRRADGTAQEYVTLPERQAVALPDDASFDLGASLGIPALTAHRCLTVGDNGPQRLAPGTLAGRVVLVAGGAGAVGNAAIQLAKWAGATVITTVSGPEKAKLAGAAGADLVINYRTGAPAEEIREFAPDGVDIVVEVAPSANAALNHDVTVFAGTIAVYATDEPADVRLPALRLMLKNIGYRFVLVYTVPEAAKRNAVEDVAAAVAAGALQVGEAAGLPLHRFSLDRTADAHAAVESGAVGKVLIDVA
ncbi:NADPH:quinone reductase [Micromonospora sp. NBC_01796]|uniref:NADPH:quinone reductase n=1 Tax=Micromonospora sp. NBC_01796 TaxID=2975987 RepID=UPI002DD7EB6E|nr:NADPH:quinone reductase [Micromonospora sp. NBC_01796]WSA89175.1 NADPH:quinone reductase [Micromonospora sp. NBC_01796]